MMAERRSVNVDAKIEIPEGFSNHELAMAFRDAIEFWGGTVKPSGVETYNVEAFKVRSMRVKDREGV